MAESGDFPLSGLADMATRALLYQRPANLAPSRQTWLAESIQYACGGIAARGAIRCAFIRAIAKHSHHAAARHA